jgi:hypothetical protein
MTTIVRELLGLFIDDGALALAIVVVVALAALAAWTLPQLPIAAGCVLLFGCIAALVVNVLLAGEGR